MKKPPARGYAGVMRTRPDAIIPQRPPLLPPEPPCAVCVCGDGYPV